MSNPRYIVVVHHGEHRSLFYVVDTAADAGEQPAVVESFLHREPAVQRASALEAAGGAA